MKGTKNEIVMVFPSGKLPSRIRIQEFLESTKEKIKPKPKNP